MSNNNFKFYFFKNGNISSGVYAGNSPNGPIIIVENNTNHVLELNESKFLNPKKINFYKLIISRTKQILSTCIHETQFDLLGKRYIENKNYAIDQQILIFLLEIINNEKQRFYRYLNSRGLFSNTTLDKEQKKELNNFIG